MVELLGVVTTDAGTGGLSSSPVQAEAGVTDDAGALSTDATAPDVDSGAAPEAATIGHGPFGPVSLIVAIANEAFVNEDPSLTGDELGLYFASTRSGTTAIWVSRRPTVTSTWGAPVLVSELGIPANEPCVSRDGLTIWFGRPGSGVTPSSHIWVASRAATTAPFGTPQQVVEVTAPGFDDEKPSVDDEALVMVFMSNRPGGAGGLDLYMSTRPSRSVPWGAPANLTEVNTVADERDPFLGGHDLQLFWAANPPMEQIRWATRSSVTEPFSAIQSLAELGVPNFDPTLSVDLRHILFSSQRARDQHQQIYEAFR